MLRFEVESSSSLIEGLNGIIMEFLPMRNEAVDL